jgi:hypothetical protein
MTEQEINEERVERLAGLVRALHALADELEEQQWFSDAHRLNEAAAYVAAVRRTLEADTRSSQRRGR